MITGGGQITATISTQDFRPGLPSRLDIANYTEGAGEPAPFRCVSCAPVPSVAEVLALGDCGGIPGAEPGTIGAKLLNSTVPDAVATVEDGAELRKRL